MTKHPTRRPAPPKFAARAHKVTQGPGPYAITLHFRNNSGEEWHQIAVTNPAGYAQVKHDRRRRAPDDL